MKYNKLFSTPGTWYWCPGYFYEKSLTKKKTEEWEIWEKAMVEVGEN